MFIWNIWCTVVLLSFKYRFVISDWNWHVFLLFNLCHLTWVDQCENFILCQIILSILFRLFSKSLCHSEVNESVRKCLVSGMACALQPTLKEMLERWVLWNFIFELSFLILNHERLIHRSVEIINERTNPTTAEQLELHLTLRALRLGPGSAAPCT